MPNNYTVQFSDTMCDWYEPISFSCNEICRYSVRTYFVIYNSLGEHTISYSTHSRVLRFDTEKQAKEFYDSIVPWRYLLSDYDDTVSVKDAELYCEISAERGVLNIVLEEKRFSLKDYLL